MTCIFAGIARLVWALALILLVLETPFGPIRLGILPDSLFYLAIAIAAAGSWPIVAELIRARRDGKRRVAERQRDLRIDVDSPMLPQAEATPPPHASPNER
jgi:hypothetical protein